MGGEIAMDCSRDFCGAALARRGDAVPDRDRFDPLSRDSDAPFNASIGDVVSARDLLSSVLSDPFLTVT